MEFVGTGLRGVGDEAAAGVAVLCREGVLHHCHFLHRGKGDRALLCSLVAFRVAESRTVEPILRCQCLAAIDSGCKLTAAEDGVSVGLHGHKAGLELQERFGQPDVSTHRGGKVAVIRLADRM